MIDCGWSFNGTNWRTAAVDAEVHEFNMRPAIRAVALLEKELLSLHNRKWKLAMSNPTQLSGLGGVLCD